MDVAHLSICIPTRNRQSYCISLLRGFLKLGLSIEHDVEVIVADNSDDCNGLSQELTKIGLLDAPWLTFLHPENKVLSMRENWERARERANGRWITFIGDDDFVDFRAVSLLRFIDQQLPDVDYVTSRRMTWEWPDARRAPTNVHIPLGQQLLKISTEELRKRLQVLSPSKNGRIEGGLAPYHAFTKRTLIDRVIELSPDKKTYFFHENVDYFTGVLQAFLTDDYLLCFRPLFLAGISRAANSYAIKKVHGRREKMQHYLDDLSQDHKYLKSNAVFEDSSDHNDKPVELFCIEYVLDALTHLSLCDDAKLAARQHKDRILEGLTRAHSLNGNLSDFKANVEVTRKILLEFFSGEDISMYDPSDRTAQIMEKGGKTALSRGLVMNSDSEYEELRVPTDFNEVDSAAEFYLMVERLLVSIDKVGMGGK